MTKTKQKRINKEMIKEEVVIVDNKRIDNLYNSITSHVRTARNNVLHTVNTEQVRAYWLIGRDIVEEEQKETKRAQYGAFLLQELSLLLTK